jgi:excisionase family DNA binding protein
MGVPMVDKLLLTPEDAAAVLSIGRSKLYELIAAGTLETVAIGACRRIPQAALDDFVDRLRTTAPPRPHDPPTAAPAERQAS